MALNKLGFAFTTSSAFEPELAQTIPQFKEIEEVVRRYLLGKDYGSGVKEVFLGILLNGLEHGSETRQPPRYRPGKYEETYPGFTLACEDTLEFDVLINPESIRQECSVAMQAQAL